MARGLSAPGVSIYRKQASSLQQRIQLRVGRSSLYNLPGKIKIKQLVNEDFLTVTRQKPKLKN